MGALRDGDVHLFVRSFVCSSVANAKLSAKRPLPRVSLMFIPPRKNSPLEIYASGGGLIIASVNVPHLCRTHRKSSFCGVLNCAGKEVWQWTASMVPAVGAYGWTEYTATVRRSRWSGAVAVSGASPNTLTSRTSRLTAFQVCLLH